MLRAVQLQTNQAKPQLGEKRKLYSRLAEEHCLPPINSYGVTKRYLDKVQAGEVFRVGAIDMNRFLAELRPSQLKRTVYTCKFEAYSKIDRLLVERGEKSLGFESGLIPDGSWLYRVARYIDRSNVCGVFEAALEDHPSGQTDTERVYRAQLRANKLLLEDTGLGKRRSIRDSVLSLMQCHKKVVSRQAEVANLQAYLSKLETQLKEDRLEMKTKLASTALQVFTEGESLCSEEALQREDEEKKRVYETVRFAYATDPVMVRDEWLRGVVDQFAEK